RGSGKTENLRSVFRSTSAEIKSGLLELEENTGPTKFFDFLPISLGYVKDFHLKLHLFTLPTNSLYESVRSVILKGVDGFIYVADARVEAMADNVDGLAATRRMLTEEGYNVAEMPRVIQYNKFDLQDIVPYDVLRQELNPGGVPDHKAVATQGLGTMETLQSMAKLVLKKISP
ncbi:cell polarity determinant GTPase MglA, partial [Planctomyces bekefii]